MITFSTWRNFSGDLKCEIEGTQATFFRSVPSERKEVTFCDGKSSVGTAQKRRVDGISIRNSFNLFYLRWRLSRSLSLESLIESGFWPKNSIDNNKINRVVIRNSHSPTCPAVNLTWPLCLRHSIFHLFLWMHEKLEDASQSTGTDAKLPWTSTEKKLLSS